MIGSIDPPKSAHGVEGDLFPHKGRGCHTVDLLKWRVEVMTIFTLFSKLLKVM